MLCSVHLLVFWGPLPPTSQIVTQAVFRCREIVTVRRYCVIFGLLNICYSLRHLLPIPSSPKASVSQCEGTPPFYARPSASRGLYGDMARRIKEDGRISGSSAYHWCWIESQDMLPKGWREEESLFWKRKPGGWEVSRVNLPCRIFHLLQCCLYPVLNWTHCSSKYDPNRWGIDDFKDKWKVKPHVAK